jgi:hypothetical protein
MNAFTKSDHGLPDSTCPAGRPELKPPLSISVSVNCGQTAIASLCIQASHIRG